MPPTRRRAQPSNNDRIPAFPDFAPGMGSHQSCTTRQPTTPPPATLLNTNARSSSPHTVRAHTYRTFTPSPRQVDRVVAHPKRTATGMGMGTGTMSARAHARTATHIGTTTGGGGSGGGGRSGEGQGSYNAMTGLPAVVTEDWLTATTPDPSWMHIDIPGVPPRHPPTASTGLDSAAQEYLPHHPHQPPQLMGIQPPHAAQGYTHPFPPEQPPPLVHTLRPHEHAAAYAAFLRENPAYTGGPPIEPPMQPVPGVGYGYPRPLPPAQSQQQQRQPQPPRLHVQEQVDQRSRHQLSAQQALYHPTYNPRSMPSQVVHTGLSPSILEHRRPRIQGWPPQPTPITHVPLSAPLPHGGHVTAAVQIPYSGPILGPAFAPAPAPSQQSPPGVVQRVHIANAATAPARAPLPSTDQQVPLPPTSQLIGQGPSLPRDSQEYRPLPRNSLSPDLHHARDFMPDPAGHDVPVVQGLIPAIRSGGDPAQANTDSVPGPGLIPAPAHAPTSARTASTLVHPPESTSGQDAPYAPASAQTSATPTAAYRLAYRPASQSAGAPPATANDHDTNANTWNGIDNDAGPLPLSEHLEDVSMSAIEGGGRPRRREEEEVYYDAPLVPESLAPAASSASASVSNSSEEASRNALFEGRVREDLLCSVCYEIMSCPFCRKETTGPHHLVPNVRLAGIVESWADTRGEKAAEDVAGWKERSSNWERLLSDHRDDPVALARAAYRATGIGGDEAEADDNATADRVERVYRVTDHTRARNYAYASAFLRLPYDAQVRVASHIAPDIVRNGTEQLGLIFIQRSIAAQLNINEVDPFLSLFFRDRIIPPMVAETRRLQAVHPEWRAPAHPDWEDNGLAAAGVRVVGQWPFCGEERFFGQEDGVERINGQPDRYGYFYTTTMNRLRMVILGNEQAAASRAPAGEEPMRIDNQQYQHRPEQQYPTHYQPQHLQPQPPLPQPLPQPLPLTLQQPDVPHGAQPAVGQLDWPLAIRPGWGGLAAGQRIHHANETIVPRIFQAAPQLAPAAAENPAGWVPQQEMVNLWQSRIDAEAARRIAEDQIWDQRRLRERDDWR